MDTSNLIYLSDVTDAEWAVLEPLVTPATRRGRPRLHPLRRILNAIFSLVRSGCAWRLLPRDLPPWQTVFTISGSGAWMGLGSGCTRCCASGCACGGGATRSRVPGLLTASRSRRPVWVAYVATTGATR